MHDATQDALELQLDAEAERFFSQPPRAWEIAHDDWQPEPLTSLERVAMLTTAAPGMALLVVAITLLFGAALPHSRPEARAAAAYGLAHDPAPAAAEPTQHRPAPSVPPGSAAHASPSSLNEPIASVPPASAVPASAALPVAARASRRFSKRPPSTVTRARRLLDAGRAEEARDLARSAVRSAPDKAGGYIVLAAALDKLGDRAGMNATFRSCVQLAKDPLASACRSLSR